MWGTLSFSLSKKYSDVALLLKAFVLATAAVVAAGISLRLVSPSADRVLSAFIAGAAGGVVAVVVLSREHRKPTGT